MAFTSFKKVFSPVSLFMLALIHFSFISDSVYVDKETETNALLLWKASLQNKNQSLLPSWTLLPNNNATNSSNNQNASSNPCSWFCVSCNHAGSVIRLSELIAQLQVLLRGVDEAEISSEKYDSSALTAQIRQLAQEIRELAVSHPVTVFNGNSASSGSYASYLVPAAALGAMGYCYIWWKGWSLSDVMFVTKHNMANAVATVSKQLENVNEALSATKRHLTQKLENLDWKVEENKETSKLIANDVNEVKSKLSQIEFDVESIRQMLSRLEGKIERLLSKQDMTNSGLLYLCQVAGGFKDGLNAKLFKDVGDTVANHSTITFEESLKGLQFIAQFIAETKESGVTDNFPGEKARTLKNRIHRSYPVGMSLAEIL